MVYFNQVGHVLIYVWYHGLFLTVVNLYKVKKKVQKVLFLNIFVSEV